MMKFGHIALFLFIQLILSFQLNCLFAQNWETLSNVPENLSFPVCVVADGKIHVMGGGAKGGATVNHYQYDPQTNNWTKKASVPYKAQQPAGAAIGNKIHYFGGGFPNSGTPLSKHYEYDASNDSWTVAADLSKARAIHYGVGLNGKVYSLAGQGVDNWCEVYDDMTNTWIRKNNLPDSKFWYGAHIAASGSIFRFCGGAYIAPVNTANRYDPQTDQWSVLPNFPVASHGISGAALGDQIYLVGGYHDFAESDEVWIYDINAKTYSKGVSLPVGRDYHNVVSLDSCIYSIGGSNAIDTSIGTSLIRFCPNSISATQQKAIHQKPTMRFSGNEFIIYFEDDMNLKWQYQIIDLEGRVVYSNKLDPATENPHKVYVSNLVNSCYRIILINEKNRYNYTWLHLN